VRWEVRAATSPGYADQPSEDAFAVVYGLAVVADGVTSLESLDDGCVHGPAWYAHQLVSHVVASHAEEPGAGPAAWLAEAITRTAVTHRHSCDLTHPGTPSSTVAMLHLGPSSASWLVLGDSSVLLDVDGRVEAVSDDRLSASGRAERAALLAGDAPLGSAEHARRLATLVERQRAYRNRDGGFWIAAADPSAAVHALVGTAPLADVRRGALLTDGVTRAVELYRTHTWPQLFDDIDIEGPAAVLARLRAVEDADPVGTRWPRTKHRDDATAVVLTRAVP
jgi:hypothetical protein